MQIRFFGLTPTGLCSLAYQLAKSNNIPVPFNAKKEQAGPSWLEGFLKCHPELSLWQPEATSIARAAGFNRVQVTRFFDLLKEIRLRNEIQPERTFNVDETGISNVQKPTKIIAKRGSKQVDKITSAERGKTITVVCAMNATGTYIPPMFIFPRKRMVNTLMRGSPHGSEGHASPSGWIDSKLFMQWLKHFKRHANPSTECKALLILDNHSSHISLFAVNFARQNGIIMLSIPPHTSHHLQPLDKTFFGPLKKFLNREMDNWMTNHPGKRVTDYETAEIFGRAYGRAATVEKSENGFCSTGIWPFNPDVFGDEDYAPSTVTEVVPVMTPEVPGCSGKMIPNAYLTRPSYDIF